MNKNILVIGILVVLILIVAVQAYQLFNIQEKVSEINTLVKVNKPVIKDSNTTGDTTGDTKGIPTNLRNLPGMVGGC